MMIERCIVVLFPLHAITFVNRRFTLILLSICIIPFWLALIPISPLVLGVQTGSMWSESGLFCGWYPDRPGFFYFLWAYQLIIFTLHVLMSALLVVILCCAIAYRHRRRRHLIRRVSSGESRREYSTFVIMIMIACINLIIFIPGLVALFISYLVDSSSWSQSAQHILANFDRFSFSVPCVAHSFNFLVYFSRIPTFRSEIINACSFCFSK